MRVKLFKQEAKMKKFFQYSLALGGLLLLWNAAPAYAGNPTVADNVLAALSSNKELSKFYALVGDAGLKETLSQKGGKFTIFAPSNDAMGKIPSDVMKRAKDQKNGLKNLVNYHIINGSVVYSGNIKGRRASPSTALGQMIDFDGTGKELKVGGGTILTPDLKSYNGVVHVVSAAMIPEVLKYPKELEEAKKKEEERMNAQREAQMKEMESRAPKKADLPQPSPEKKDAAAEPAPSAQPEAAASPAPVADSAAPVKKEEKSGWKKWLGF